jgi:hypothetical protein
MSPSLDIVADLSEKVSGEESTDGSSASDNNKPARRYASSPSTTRMQWIVGANVNCIYCFFGGLGTSCWRSTTPAPTVTLPKGSPGIRGAAETAEPGLFKPTSSAWGGARTLSSDEDAGTWRSDHARPVTAESILRLCEARRILTVPGQRRPKEKRAST